MSDNELFGEADARSEDSFIVNSEPSVHSEDDDYEFLFGTNVEETVDKKVKTRGKRVKDLENLLRERKAAYNDFEGTEDEIRYTVDELADHWDRRQALESEILSLFSSLLTKEQISVDSVHTAHTQSMHSVYNENHIDGESNVHEELGGSTSFNPPESSRSNTQQTTDADPESNPKVPTESNRIVGKLMKRLIKQTFRDKAPEGRFGSYSKASDVGKEKANHEFRLNTVTSIGKDALPALRDINTLLNRERGNDYEELDGVPLYKHTRPVTIYIFMNNFILSHILPLCTLLSRGAVSNPDIDTDAISKEIIYLLYQLSQPPSEAWYKYWVEAEQVYTSLNAAGSKDDSISSEIKCRMRVIEDYIYGLGVLRSSIVSNDIWFLVGEFRVKLEHFKREKFRTPAQTAHMHELRELQDKLSKERDELVQEMKGDEDEEENVTHGRLRKDRNVRDANRKRLHELRKQLVRISGEIADENESVAIAEKQTLLHIATVRILIVQILTIPGNDLPILVILNESGLLSTIKTEIIASFESCKSGFIVSEDGNVESHAAYLSETQRATLWEYVRLVHAITSCVSISRIFATPYMPTKQGNKSVEYQTGRTSGTQSKISNDDQKIIELARLNPKLARMRIRGSTSDISTFKIDEHAGRTRKLSDYDRLFRFPTSEHTNPYSSFLSDSNSTFGKYAPIFAEGVTPENLKNLQLELQSLVGIDIDFEHIHYNQDGVHVYYELGLLLSLLFSDISREAEDRYSLPCDVEVLLDLKSWVISYYTTLYLNENKRRDSKGLEKLPEAFVLLALRRYVGNENLMPKVTCMYIWRLIRKSGMRKSSSLGAASALRSFYADLMLVFSFSNCINEHVLDILKQLISSYLTNNIKSALFWILRFFKPLSHTTQIFVYSLSSLHLLSKIVTVMGNISYTVEKSQNRAISLDYDDDSDDSMDGGLTKRVVLSKNSIFSSKHISQDVDSTPKDVIPDIMYNGRVIYNCVFLLSNFRNNDPYLNDLLITHLEMLPPGLLYDLKYFYTFRNIIKDRRVWQNAHWRWIGEFCIYTLERFFDSWLMEENFKALPIELFYNKASTATVGPFRPCSRDHILPLSNGYKSCQILGSLLKNPDLSIYEVAREVKGMPMSLWTREDDATLLKYASQFSFLDDPHTYIAELLGRPVKEVTRRLSELNEQMNKEDNNDVFVDASTQTFKLKEACNIFYVRYPDIASTTLSELHENISESIEMKRLGGLDAICEVMEPISASQDILDSPEFLSILACLKIENWILPSDLDLFEQFLKVIKDPDSYNSAEIPLDMSGIMHGPADTTVYDIYKPSKFEALKMNFTSRDIARLILDIKDVATSAKDVPDPMTSVVDQDSIDILEKSMDTLDIFGNDAEKVDNLSKLSDDYIEILQESLRLIDSAVILGRSESMCKNLPQDILSLQKLSDLLNIANVRINPPLLICESVGDGTIAKDRLQMAVNLFKLPEQRLRDISSYVPQGFVVDTHQAQSTVDTDFPMDDEATLDFSKDPFESNIMVNRTKKKRLKKSRTVENDEAVNMNEPENNTLEKMLQTYRKGLKFGRLKKHNKIDLVLGNVLERLSSGLYEMNAAELMSLGMDTSLFKDFDKSLTNLSNLVKSSGATVEYVGDRLMFSFTHESSQVLKDYLGATFKETDVSVSVPKRTRVKKRRNIPTRLDIGVGVLDGLDPVETFNFDPFKNLESSVDLVSQLHKQSLELAAQKRLYNGITREALQTIL
ncbi:conserved hypothetical protein [Theileria equi strain WA]|uniref:Uncharacterized protein n=1 Tax=Theileria equi strain WA TaxID=1537102 RepID=L1LCA6_THEEQ|nr:conserved hypothetical protein [Theileria equi strain WA]EKX72885.1 conserved hypothetical protein [Theileria equi strain WA]|eukprot:XP_004832337.1 conserved hypothetical protein [Theileria equi strain WA]